MIRWISADLAITRTDEAPLTSDDTELVIDVVVDTLEQAGYDVCGTAKICEAPEGVIVTEIQEIAARILARSYGRYCDLLATRTRKRRD